MHKLAHREDYAQVLALYTRATAIVAMAQTCEKPLLWVVYPSVKNRKNHFDVFEGCLIVLKVSGGKPYA
jgi:hypothetical protein